WPDRAAEDLDQRRLARAVLADERVDFAAADLEVDVVERPRRAVRLRQPLRREQRHDFPSVWALTIPTSTATTGGTVCPARCLAIISIAVRPMVFGDCATSALSGPPLRIAAWASGVAS